MDVEQAVRAYQCPGCISGPFEECYKSSGAGCEAHHPATMGLGIGKILLGLPKGFNRMGQAKELHVYIYPTWADFSAGYNFLNVPVWMTLDEHGHTIVRTFSPRVNYSWIQVFLEDCRDKVGAFEITEEVRKEFD